MVKYLPFLIGLTLMVSCSGNGDVDYKVKITVKGSSDNAECYYDGRTDKPVSKRIYSDCYGKDLAHSRFTSVNTIAMNEPLLNKSLGSIVYMEGKGQDYTDKRTYIYDKNGYLDSVIHVFGYNGQSEEKTTSIFNHDKSKLLSITELYNGEKSTINCFYDDKGYIYKEIPSNTEGVDSIIFRRDNDGRLIAIENYKNGTSDEYWERFSYIGKNLTMSELTDHGIYMKSEYSYSNGRISKIIVKDSTGNIKYQNTYSYDGKNNLSSQKKTTNEGTTPEFTFTYDFK